MSIERAEADLIRAKADVARLAAQLSAAESRMVKIEHYIEMARAYDGQDTEDSRTRNGGSPLVQACVDIIRERGTRQHTRALVEELERLGYRIGGANKVTNLSGALSRSPVLSPSRADGWGLIEWEAAANHSDAIMSPATIPAVQATPERAASRAAPDWEPSGDFDDEIPF